MQREATILPSPKDPSQEAAPQLPGLEFRTARKARRARKEADARGLEQAREYLGTTAPRSLTPQAVLIAGRGPIGRGLLEVGPDSDEALAFDSLLVNP